MNITNTIKNKNLHSVNFFTSYASWASNINASSSKLVNQSLKVAASVLSTFVLIGSIFIFVFHDVPMLIKEAYNYFTKSKSPGIQLLKPLFIIGSGFLAYRGYESIVNKINSIKKNALLAVGVATLIGLGIGAYSIGYLPI